MLQSDTYPNSDMSDPKLIKQLCQESAKGPTKTRRFTRYSNIAQCLPTELSRDNMDLFCACVHMLICSLKVDMIDVKIFNNDKEICTIKSVYDFVLDSESNSLILCDTQDSIIEAVLKKGSIFVPKNAKYFVVFNDDSYCLEFNLSTVEDVDSTEPQTHTISESATFRTASFSTALIKHIEDQASVGNLTLALKYEDEFNTRLKEILARIKFIKESGGNCNDLSPIDKEEYCAILSILNARGMNITNPWD